MECRKNEIKSLSMWKQNKILQIQQQNNVTENKHISEVLATGLTVSSILGNYYTIIQSRFEQY